MPKELLLGLIVNSKPADLNHSILPIAEEDTALQMAYVAQQQLDGYAEAVAHALKQKSAFDKRVLAQKPGEVIFTKNQLVQIYRNDLDFTFKTEQKLLPKWSVPHRIISRNLNSYTLKTLHGDELPGSFRSRRLRRFIPKEGNKLAEEQRLLEAQDGVIAAEKRDDEQTAEEAATHNENTTQPDDM